MAAARRALLASVKAAAAAGDRLRPAEPGLVVLLYHRVGRRTASPVDLPADLFEEQVRVVAAERRCLRLGDALDLLRAGGVATHGPVGPEDRRPPVVVTFDDGTDDVLDVALPILERHGVPATLYVATDFVDAGRTWFDQGRPLSWAGVRELVASGLVEIGSHTDRHVVLGRAGAALAAAELDRSIDRLRDNVGIDPLDFAYPNAVPGSTAADAAVRARFRSAAEAGNRSNVAGRTDPHRLGRTPVQVEDGMRWFLRKLDGGLALEGRLREALDRRRRPAAVA